VNLNSGVKYALVVRAPMGGGGNVVKWLTDTSAPDYACGSRESSGDGGTTWQTDAASDYLFEIVGPQGAAAQGALPPCAGGQAAATVQPPASSSGTSVLPPTASVPAVTPVAGTRLVAESRTASPGDTVLLPVRLENAQGMGSLGFTVTYDPAVIQYVKTERGAVIPSNASFVPNSPQAGTVILAFAGSSGFGGSGQAAQLEFKAVGSQGSSSPGRVWLGMVDASGINGSGTLAIIQFDIVGSGDRMSSLNIEKAAAYRSSNLAEILVQASNGSVKARGKAVSSPALAFSP
jgi:hypothetical protein